MCAHDLSFACSRHVRALYFKVGKIMAVWKFLTLTSPLRSRTAGRAHKPVSDCLLLLWAFLHPMLFLLDPYKKASSHPRQQ